jgi:hypothetical protein
MNPRSEYYDQRSKNPYAKLRKSASIFIPSLWRDVRI